MRISTNCCGFLVALFCIGSGLSVAAQPTTNLVANSSFETRNQEPQGNNNISPFSTYNDLPNWQNAKATPDYMTSTTPVETVNTLQNNVGYGEPIYEPFYPRTGTGCVRIVGYRIQNTTDSYEFVRQQLSGLIINHRYHASFYALRRPTTQYKSKLSLTVYNSEPYYDSRSASVTLTPSPHTSIVSQGYITDTNNWTLVEGDFIARASTQWIALGYEGKDEVFDPSIKYVPETGSFKQFTDNQVYMLDDVSVVDRGCAPAIYDGSFYISRYEGCRKIYGFTLKAVPNAVNYYASVSVDGVNRAGAAGAHDPAAGNDYIIFPLDLEGDGREAVATITITTAGPCPTQTYTTSMILQRPDPGCTGTGGDGTMNAVSPSYPNPASESLTVSRDIEEATLFDGRGRAVQKSSKSGKVNVQDLPEGLYNLRMIRKGKIINQRIQVKH